MDSRSARRLGIAIVLALSGAAMGAGQGVDRAAEALARDFPGVRLRQAQGGGVSIVYGKPMTGAATADEAAALWWNTYADVFGVPGLALVRGWAGDASHGKFTAFHYTQSLGGVPVDESVARVLVLNGNNNVVYAAAKLTAEPEGGFAPDAVDATAAIESVALRHANLIQWTEPEMVIYSGGVDNRDLNGAGGLGAKITPVRAWTFIGDNTDRPNRVKLRFFVDAATGALVGIRNEIKHTDVTGKVTGKFTPGTLPDRGDNPPVLTNLEALRVAITGGNTAYTDENGDYTIVHGGQSQVTVTTTLGNAIGSGRWVRVDNQAGAELLLSQNVTPPGPANFEFNSAPLAGNTAQVNAFYHTTLTHDFITDRSGFTELDDDNLVAFVNLAQTCNAYYDGDINFFSAGGGCVNTAYSSVVSHEYGHYIVAELLLAQGAFGEGFGDCVGMLLHDSPIVGEDFYTSGADIRRPDEANRQYPCSGEVHFCGELLAGVWWEVVKNMRAFHGSDLGMELTRQLFVDWAMDTTGGSGGNSARPETAIEVLVANDDDGDIDNGTPDYFRICAAFGAHNIDCPVISLLAFQYPDGIPNLLSPGADTDIAVNVVGVTEQPAAGSGRVYYSIDGGAYQNVAMAEGLPNQYTATLPALDCGQDVRFYFSAQTTGAVTVFDPPNAPTSFYSAVPGDAYITVLTDDFEANQGWTVGGAGDDATTGIWVRDNPRGTDAQPEDDHTNPGTFCFFTGQGPQGGGLGDQDVDNGQTTLTTPTIDLSAHPEASISYWRWYSNDTGADPNDDIFVVDISNNGGGSWVRAETVGPSGAETHAGWFFHSLRVADFVAPSATVKLRFIASDEGDGSLVEAALDDFLVQSLQCEDPPSCPADMNGDGQLNVFDFLAFQTFFSEEDARADLAAPFGVFNVFDFLAFQTLFGEGC